MSAQTGPIFQEVQKFSSWVLVVLFSIMIFAVIIITLAAKSIITPGSPFHIFSLIAAIVLPLCLIALFLLTRLETQVRPDGLFVRFFPFHIHFKKFGPGDIAEYYARQYNPLLEYGGWGIRYGRGGRAYNAKGNKGVQLVFKDGNRLLIGSQKPDELLTALNSVLRKTD
jgi:hypothetical protein